MINAAAITNSKVSQYRLRVRYRKDGRLAYLGHLEVINTINRSVRRSQLPFAVGNGFARRMRLQFSQALPVGAASMGEYFDLFLTQETDPQDAL
ncbi:MAG: TIGR03936 family radical SAM-associated protein, partial [Olsenella sp.]|nr:TIGR03936 family radical SAM-associated protein [Olsenella sp.]MCI2159319.1 TIGR03936 family radical SAM-associated protein [Olsenella sp.]